MALTPCLPYLLDLPPHIQRTSTSDSLPPWMSVARHRNINRATFVCFCARLRRISFLQTFLLPRSHSSYSPEIFLQGGTARQGKHWARLIVHGLGVGGSCKLKNAHTHARSDRQTHTSGTHTQQDRQGRGSERERLREKEIHARAHSIQTTSDKKHVA